MRKKIPYGLQSFEKIIEDGYLYIDKTHYIEKLETLNENYPVFLRPRKFGKTLWINTLYAYYDINNKEKSDKIFQDLYIGKNPTPKKNSYYILKFNFSGIDTRNDEVLYKCFKSSVVISLSNFIHRYNLNLNQYIDETEEVSTIFNKVLEKFSELNLDNKIYLLIDEYDHFANELLGFRLNSFKEVICRTGFVRKFFEEIKKGTETVIDRLYITGVSPITLDSMTSGFNIANNITLNPEFNGMLGFTKEEVESLLDLFELDPELLQEMELAYNGYKFSEEVLQKVYNSDMVLYFLNEYLKVKKNPREILDPNISSDYKKIQKLFEFNSDYKNIMQDLLNDEILDINITKEFNLEKEQTRDDFLSLLFYLGFVTIRESKITKSLIGIPNYAIKLLYYSYLNMLLRLENENLTDVLEEIVYKGKIDIMVNELNRVLKTLSNRDLIKFDEKHIKLIIMSYLHLMKQKVYIVKSEYEVEDGYIDIMMFRRYKEIPYQIMMELKYIKQSDVTEEKITRKIDEGKQQIQNYIKAKELQNDEYLNKYVIVGSGKKLVRYVQV